MHDVFVNSTNFDNLYSFTNNARLLFDNKYSSRKTPTVLAECKIKGRQNLN